MKKIVLAFLVVLLVSSSCKKDGCWIIMDCMGNDLMSRCGSESEIQSYCAANSTPGCTWNYRRE
jgi:hypothetical protein